MQIILVLYPEFIPLGVSPAIKPTHQIGHKKKNGLCTTVHRSVQETINTRNASKDIILSSFGGRYANQNSC